MEFLGICLITKDVPTLAEFYAKVLGVKAEGNDVHAEIRTKGAGLAIFSIKGMEDMVKYSMKGAGNGSFTLAFKVDDVDAEYRRLKDMDIKFVKLPTTHSWGERSLWFRDPDNNIIDFTSSPK